MDYWRGNGQLFGYRQDRTPLNLRSPKRKNVLKTVFRFGTLDAAKAGRNSTKLLPENIMGRKAATSYFVPDGRFGGRGLPIPKSPKRKTVLLEQKRAFYAIYDESFTFEGLEKKSRKKLADRVRQKYAELSGKGFQRASFEKEKLSLGPATDKYKSSPVAQPVPKTRSPNRVSLRTGPKYLPYFSILGERRQATAEPFRGLFNTSGAHLYDPKVRLDPVGGFFQTYRKKNRKLRPWLRDPAGSAYYSNDHYVNRFLERYNFSLGESEREEAAMEEFNLPLKYRHETD